MRETVFEKRCKRVADEIGICVDFYDGKTGQKPFEDDGTLHIVRRGVRACFDVSNSQNLSGRKQNDLTRKVMAAMEMPVTDNVLVEDWDDDDCCETCGRAF